MTRGSRTTIVNRPFEPPVAGLPIPGRLPVVVGLGLKAVPFARMPNRLVGLIAFVLSGLSCVHTAAAQDSGSGSISGYVLDSSGSSVSGAVVRAENVAEHLSRVTVSDARGYYVLPALTVTTYSVS